MNVVGTMQVLLIASAGLSIIVVGVVIYNLFHKGRQGQRVANYADVMHELTYPVTCPKCGGSMEAGFVVANRGIFYRSELSPPPRAVPMWDAMTNTANMTARAKDNRAWHCAGCQVLVIDHSYLLAR